MTNAITVVLLHAWSKNSKNYFNYFCVVAKNVLFFLKLLALLFLSAAKIANTKLQARFPM